MKALCGTSNTKGIPRDTWESLPCSRPAKRSEAKEQSGTLIADSDVWSQPHLHVWPARFSAWGLYSIVPPDYNVKESGRLDVLLCTCRYLSSQGAAMASESQVQYVSDDDGNEVAVIIPIELWREIESERETAYLLKSDAMKARLLEAKHRTGGISLDEVRKKLGV